MPWKENLLYYKQSPFQNILFFSEADGSYSLTLDNYLQFNSASEHIYHELLFTLPALFPKKLEKILILGGGDGLGTRELLKFPTVKSIEVVDIDPDMIDFAKNNFFMKWLNQDSFNHPLVKIYIEDAKKWLAKPITHTYDLIIVDFPDPNTPMLWELYSSEITKQISSRLNQHGVVCLQSSRYNSRLYRKIFNQLDAAYQYIIGYHNQSLVEMCGFFLVSHEPIKLHRHCPTNMRFLTPLRINQILHLPIYKVNPKFEAQISHYYKVHP